MALTKTVNIDGRDVTFRASAAIPRIYRNRFHRDIYKDLHLVFNNENIPMPASYSMNLSDGRADGHTEKICQASGAARIYGMNLCKTEKFSGCAACLSGCGIPAVYRQGCAFLRQFWQTAHTSVPFWEGYGNDNPGANAHVR